MPSEISVLLGTEPTLAREKGKEWRTPKGEFRIATRGQWHLNASDTKLENLDDQLAELLGKLRTDLSVWSKLSTAFEMTFFAGGLCKRATMGLKFKTRQQAMQEITEWFEIFYNRQRKQEKLGYLSPAQFSQQYYANLLAA